MSEFDAVFAAALDKPLVALANAAASGRAAVLSEAVTTLTDAIVGVILADRASQLADERQRFVDDMAKRLFATPEYSRTDEAYDDAELLWAEREIRRLAKPEPHPTMKRYRGTDGSLVDAFQITAEWFDGEHPNPLHVVGVETDPVARCVHPRNAAGSSRAYVGDWIVRKPGAEHWFAYGPDFLSDHTEVK